MPTIKVSTFENAIAVSVKVYEVSTDQAEKVRKFFDKLNSKSRSMSCSDTTMLNQ